MSWTAGLLKTALACAATLCLGSAAATTSTATPAPDAAERQRISSERQAVEARFEAAQRDCAGRFLVNDCLDNARQARRLALEPLQRQQHLLDDARRRARAADRLQAIQARDAAPRPGASAAPAASVPSPNAAAAAAPASGPALRRAVRSPANVAAADAQARQRQARAQQRALAAEARQQAVQARQQAVQARNARRDAKKPAAAGLPVPGASAP